ncbi:MAG: hypothetical protein C4320_00270 [Armatimonadota bacterium]
MDYRLITGALALTLTAAANAQFTGNDIYVNTLNFGGSAARTNLGNVATVQRFNQTTNAFDQQFNTGVINSGTATSEGALLFDPTSATLWLAGYSSVSASGSVTSTTSASNPRVAAQLLANGTVNKFTTATDYSGNNIRSAVGIGADVYTSGGVGGSRMYTPSGTALGTGTQSSSATNTRHAAFYDGLLYSSTASGTAGIFAGNSPTPLVTSTSPYQFRFLGAGLQTLYVADDSAATNPLSGISKYLKDGSGTYVLQGTYKLPGLTTGTTTSARYFALQNNLVNGVNVTTIVAATTEDSGTIPNRLVSFLDDNSFAAPTAYTTLATAGTNEVFRGVEAVPEPASMAIIGVGLVSLFARRRRNAK